MAQSASPHRGMSPAAKAKRKPAAKKKKPAAPKKKPAAKAKKKTPAKK